MEAQQAKEYVKNHLEEYLQRKGIDTRKPFLCLNPLHNDRKPSMSLHKTARSGAHCKCFSCNVYYDTFDLIGIDYNLSDPADIFRKGYELFGLSVDGANPKSTPANINTGRMEQGKETKLMGVVSPVVTEKIDLTKEVKEAHKELLGNAEALKHYTDRGLTLPIIEKYMLGYSPAGINTFLKGHKQNQLGLRKAGLYKYILPILGDDGLCSYCMAEISDRQEIDDYNRKYCKPKGIPAQLFNQKYMEMDNPPNVLFITEGIYDALSIEEAGGKAVALCGLGRTALYSFCEKRKPSTVFVLALDTDEAGEKAAAEIMERLQEAGADVISKPAWAGVKDMNEALATDRERFMEYIQQSIAEAEDIKYQEEQQAREEYLQGAAVYHVQELYNVIQDGARKQYFPTGFESVDNLIDGGLYAGLYVIGAISSLGKTTFCLQVMDNIAKAGNDVLVFSLEMSRHELMTKSISRLSLMESIRQYKTKKYAKTTRGISTGARWQHYTKKETDLLESAFAAYTEYSEHIFIHEGVGDIGVEQIRAQVEKHIRITGNKPVIVIDYLQILAPYNDKATDKQNTDKSILELKRLSRDMDIPVLGISSFNRDNYTNPVNMSSYKESGSLEYSSDVLIGLQYAGMDYQQGENEKDKNRSQRIRDMIADNMARAKQGKAQAIQLKILKNRNGSKGDTVLDFYPMFNYFAEPKDRISALCPDGSERFGEQVKAEIDWNAV